MSKSEPSHKNILVVEDDRYTNELICSTLTMAGYKVVSFMTGEEVLEFTKKNIPDLIVLDLLLPKMDGWEVCRELRREGARTRRVPIVICSVASRYEMEQSKDAMGILSFFNKPFDPKDLINEVARIFDLI